MTLRRPTEDWIPTDLIFVVLVGALYGLIAAYLLPVVTSSIAILVMAFLMVRRVVLVEAPRTGSLPYVTVLEHRLKNRRVLESSEILTEASRQLCVYMLLLAFGFWTIVFLERWPTYSVWWIAPLGWCTAALVGAELLRAWQEFRVCESDFYLTHPYQIGFWARLVHKLSAVFATTYGLCLASDYLHLLP